MRKKAKRSRKESMDENTRMGKKATSKGIVSRVFNYRGDPPNQKKIRLF